MTEKPKTIFVDIDGTLLQHQGSLPDTILRDPILLEGVIEKFIEWTGKSYKIIITTARPESMRDVTKGHLEKFGICYDVLLMGLTSGQRILINDKKPSHNTAALAINVERNGGLEDIII